MKFRFFIFIIALINIPSIGSAQWSVSGAYPRTIPTNPAYAKNHVDTLTGRTFYFKYPKWYMRGEIISASTPTDSVYFVSGVGVIMVSYANSHCKWFNTNTNTFWYWTGTAWQNPASIDMNLINLLDSVNNWNKKNTFKDSLTADKGIKSGGLIDTKGLNTEGGASKSAANFNGVRKGKRRVITSNTTLDGTDFLLEIQCSTADITINTPPLTAETEGWIFDIIRTDSTGYKAIFHRPSGADINILNKRAATLRNNSVNWNFD